MPKALITGLGPFGAAGTGVPAFWRNICQGNSSIATVSRFDSTSFSCRVAGESDDSQISQRLDAKTIRTTAHATQLALVSAQLALESANLDSSNLEPDAVGVSIGTALGGWVQGEQLFGILAEKGARRVNPFVASGSPPYGAGVEVANFIGACGFQTTLSVGCPSSSQALNHAASLIRAGELELCLSGGTESPLSPLIFASLGRTKELTSQNERPEIASCPFDSRHQGLVLSEGACLLTIEPDNRGSSNSGQVYAEILGGTTSCDAKGLYQFDETGEAGARAIHRLLRKTGVEPGEIDYVCAHANSSPAFDRKEITVLKKAFGEFAARMPISSIKGVLGHPFGASGAFQTAAAALAIHHGVIPPTHNLEDPDPACDLDIVAGEPRKANIRHALVTSYGYGGVNSYLLLRKYE